MIARALHLWERLRSSLWFVPACMSVGAVALALGAARLDTLWEEGQGFPLAYSGGREGARILLSTVAGSMITVAGVTFSVTVVALSLASSQFGPRLLVNFMRDRGNQFVLGTFIATFLFCLVALGQGGREADAVPAASATIGLALAAASIAVLIYFIHHVSSSIRADEVVDGVARDLERRIDALFPETPSESAEPEAIEAAESSFAEDPATVVAPRHGYLQRVDEDRLLSIAVEEDLVLRLTRRPGHFLAPGEALVELGKAREDPSPALVARLEACFILGRERTPEQDPERGVHQLVEVALRALSPGVNDPYTAMSCIDWLGAVLCKVGSRPVRNACRTCPDGEVRLIAYPIDFSGMLDAAFNQIRQFARPAPAVSMRMLEMLERIGRSVGERKERREAVREQIEMVFRGARPETLEVRDREDLEARYRSAIEVVAGTGG